MAIKYEKYQLNELISMIRQHEVLLPNFQRDYVWKSYQQERLASSCLLGLPVGGLLMLKGLSNDFSYRDIAGLSNISSKIGVKEVNFLLDGQQRITSLKFIFDDPFFHSGKNWDDICREISQSLKVKFFLDISFHESSSDPFGYKLLKPLPIDTLEPSDIENRIKINKVNISGSTTKQFHHPKKFIELENTAKKEGKKSPSHAAALELVKHYSDKKIIPLFTVFWDKNHSRYPYALHEKVIDFIAENRAIELKEEYATAQEFEILELFDSIHQGLSDEIIDPITGEYLIDKGWFELSSRWAKNIKTMFEQVVTMEMPSTDLPRKEISRAASIFEELNNSGTKLRVFDLLVARAARSDFLGDKTLADFIIEKVSSDVDISPVKNKIQNWKATELGVIDGKVLDNQFQDVYLNLLSLISNAKEIGVAPSDVKFIKKDAILSIKPEKINRNTERTIIGISRALAFLQMKCGVSKLSEVPYLLMILPIAYCFEEDLLWESNIAQSRVEFWYWDSLFNGRYRERQNERCVSDVNRLHSWLEHEISPFDKNYQPKVFQDGKYNDLNTLLMKDPDNLPNENFAKAIRQFVLGSHSRDFTDTAEVLFCRDVSLGKIKLQKHHIIPLGSATTIKQSSNEIRQNKEHILNSPLNFTLISDHANNKIGSMPVNTYLTKLGSWSVSSHLLHTTLIKALSQGVDQNFEVLLEERFNLLQNAVLSKLNDLSKNAF